MAKTLLTTLQTAAGFGVSDMSIYTWRAGTPTREKLPVVKGPKGEAPTAVRFDADVMARYAKKHGLTFNLQAALAFVKPKDTPAAKKVAAKKAAPGVKKAGALAGKTMTGLTNRVARPKKAPAGQAAAAA